MKQEMLDMLNEQMNFEFYSAHVYLAMAGYAAEAGLPGFENWFKVQYEEEIFHARKFMDYITAVGGRVNLRGFQDMDNDFASILDAFETTLKHENEVTERIHNLMGKATELRDFRTTGFLQWFVDEQIEEEENVTNLIQKIKMVKDAGLYMLDKDLAGRVFTAPTNA